LIFRKSSEKNEKNNTKSGDKSARLGAGGSGFWRERRGFSSWGFLHTPPKNPTGSNLIG